MFESIIPPAALPLFFAVAFLYSSVGHGGGSGYLALFAMLGIASSGIVPVALILNIFAASTGFWHYWRRGCFSPSMLLPFVLSSIPAAFVGGMLHVPTLLFSLLLGGALLLAASRLMFMPGIGPGDARPPSRRTLWLSGVPMGAALGLLSGMIGIGGGVFLSPLLLFLCWTDAKQTAALSSGFIVLNSVSGLAGQMSRGSIDVSGMLPLLVAVGIGGYLGSRTGAFRFQPRTVQGLLAVVLLMAAAKLLAKALM